MAAAAIKGLPARFETDISATPARRPAARAAAAFPIPPRRMRARLRSVAGENPTIRP